MAKIPKFKTLEEAAGFWETHDFEDYLENTVPVKFQVKIPRRTRMVTVPLPLKVFQLIEAVALEQGEPVEQIVTEWLKDRALQQSPGG